MARARAAASLKRPLDQSSPLSSLKIPFQQAYLVDEQRFSSSSTMVQHFLIIQKNLADFPTVPRHECKPSTDSCKCSMEPRLTHCPDQQLRPDAPRKRHG